VAAPSTGAPLPGADETIAVEPAAIRPMELERIRPAAFRDQVVPLDRARRRYRVGRSERCDIRLYSPSASREHMDLALGPDGYWYAIPLAGKIARIGTTEVFAETRLEPGAVLYLGEDELRLQPAGEAPVASERAPWISIGLAAAGLLVLAVMLLYWLG
jgi:pSer/pThr/pTyr-binding forkhead associated (FHA) protein